MKIYTCVLYKNYEDRNTATSPIDKAKVTEQNETPSQVADTLYRWEDNHESFMGFDVACWEIPFAVWQGGTCVLRSSFDTLGTDGYDLLEWVLEWKESNMNPHLDIALDQWLNVRVEYDGQPIGNDEYWGYEDLESVCHIHKPQGIVPSDMVPLGL